MPYFIHKYYRPILKFKKNIIISRKYPISGTLAILEEVYIIKPCKTDEKTNF